MTTKTFPLRVVLTITTGRLLTARKGPNDNGIGDVYEILNWITQDHLWTHQLPRAGEQACPFILKEYPELELVNNRLVELDDLLHKSKDVDITIDVWLRAIQKTYNLADSYQISQLNNYTPKEPFTELLEKYSITGDEHESIH